VQRQLRNNLANASLLSHSHQITNSFQSSGNLSMNNILSSSFEMEDDLLEEKKDDQSSHEKVYEVSPVVSDDMIDVHQVPAYIWSFALHLKKERNFTVSQILEQLGKKACVEAIYNVLFFSFLFFSFH
jgi:hypothetical protein